ncbi:hypothetical protein AAJV73_04340 [Cyanobium sp. BSA11S]|uniref:hypothetical protein n=2 Tax=Synechococcales TaxID=1890424 RepID=UPI003D81C1CD
MGQGDRRGFSSTSATPVTPRQHQAMSPPPPPRTSACARPSPNAGRGPPDPGERMVGKVLTGNGISAPSRWAGTL